MKNYFFWILLLVVFGGGAVFLFWPKAPAKGNYDDFAKCLSSKDAVMYGAYWCPHCQNEKKSFGDSFRFVNYIECTQETGKCLTEKINGYPTWIFPASSAGGPDGKRFEGEMGLERLSRESGCLLDNKN